jgi:hypothetical protein
VIVFTITRAIVAAILVAAIFVPEIISPWLMLGLLSVMAGDVAYVWFLRSDRDTAVERMRLDLLEVRGELRHARYEHQAQQHFRDLAEAKLRECRYQTNLLKKENADLAHLAYEDLLDRILETN